MRHFTKLMKQAKQISKIYQRSPLQRTAKDIGDFNDFKFEGSIRTIKHDSKWSPGRGKFAGGKNTNVSVKG